MKTNDEMKAYFIPTFFLHRRNKPNGTKENIIGYIILNTHAGSIFKRFEYKVGRIVILNID
jgi:hypothetical protein